MSGARTWPSPGPRVEVVDTSSRALRNMSSSTSVTVADATRPCPSSRSRREEDQTEIDVGVAEVRRVIGVMPQAVDGDQRPASRAYTPPRAGVRRAAWLETGHLQ